MCACKFSGKYDITTDAVRGQMRLELQYPTSTMNMETSWGIGGMALELSPVVSLTSLNLTYPDSRMMMCIPAVDRVVVVWYVHGNYTVTMSGKMFGYVYFK